MGPFWAAPLLCAAACSAPCRLLTARRPACLPRSSPQMPPLNPYGGMHPGAFRPPVSAAMQKVASMPILGHPGMLSPQATGEREGQKRRAESPIPEDGEWAGWAGQGGGGRRLRRWARWACPVWHRSCPHRRPAPPHPCRRARPPHEAACQGQHVAAQPAGHQAARCAGMRGGRQWSCGTGRPCARAAGRRRRQQEALGGDRRQQREWQERPGRQPRHGATG